MYTWSLTIFSQVCGGQTIFNEWWLLFYTYSLTCPLEGGMNHLDCLLDKFVIGYMYLTRSIFKDTSDFTDGVLCFI